ncbi:MAG: AI-2E family transporter [Campylobacterota bacterium]|nr:AI-2E family transporter [Campylobacterota bacterium]
MKKARFNRITILVLTFTVSAVFIYMINGFLTAIFMAALFAGILYPLYKKLKGKFKGKTSAAAMVTLLLFIFVVLIPLSGLLAVILDQAIDAGKSAGPILKEMVHNPGGMLNQLESIPWMQELFPNPEKLAHSIDDVIKSLGNFLIHGLSDFSSGTASFILSLFIFLFTLYYFLIYGKSYLETALYYLPLDNHEESMLLSRFTRVTVATIKGTFLIGLIQGVLGAIGLALAGVDNVFFWGLMMTLLSVIPAVGPAIIWLPAAIWLMMQGNTAQGIGLMIYGGVLVGNIDNLLRPRLVGKDAQMPDLMILFGTLGGLALFGISGIIIGPIIAALFISLWEIYGEAFKEYLYPIHIDGFDTIDTTEEEKDNSGQG